MTAGAQGHPGWVDNHPTTLKFLAASQACLHQSRYTVKVVKSIEGVDSLTGSQLPCLKQREDKPTENLDEDELPMDTSDEEVLTTSVQPEIPDQNSIEIAPGYRFPLEISELLLYTLISHYPNRATLENLSMYGHTDKCKLKRAILRGSAADDECVELLLKHALTHLDIRDCKRITRRTIQKVNNAGAHLQMLAVSDNFCRGLRETNMYLMLPRLRCLILHNLSISSRHFSHLFSTLNLKNLTSVDFSCCEDLDNISPLIEAPLTNITLYNCNVEDDWLICLQKITTLR